MVHTSTANSGQLCPSNSNATCQLLMSGRILTERQQLRLALSLSASNRDIHDQTQSPAQASMVKLNVAAVRSPRTKVASATRLGVKQHQSPKNINSPSLDSRTSGKDRSIRSSKGKRRPTFVPPFDVKKVVKKLLDISDRVPFSGVKDSNLKASAEPRGDFLAVK